MAARVSTAHSMHDLPATVCGAEVRASNWVMSAKNAQFPSFMRHNTRPSAASICVCTQPCSSKLQAGPT